MVQCPLLNDPGCLLWQRSERDFSVGYPDERCKALIARLEVWRRMIVVLHPDNDAKEKRDDRHRQARCRGAQQMKRGRLSATPSLLALSENL
jgi:hypothetical protein